MTWQNILKQKYREKYNEVFADVIEVKKIIDFIKSNRSLLTRESDQPYIHGKLTKEVASLRFMTPPLKPTSLLNVNGWALISIVPVLKLTAPENVELALPLN